jgi:hypothetical protein
MISLEDAIAKEDVNRILDGLAELCENGLGYKLVKECQQTESPPAIISRSKGELSRLLKRGIYAGIVSCRHYAKKSLWRQPEEGLILTVEYVSGIDKKVLKEVSENSDCVSSGEIHTYGNLILGRVYYRAYGRGWNGGEDYLVCCKGKKDLKRELNVPQEAIIKSVDLPQIMERISHR